VIRLPKGEPGLLVRNSKTIRIAILACMALLIPCTGYVRANETDQKSYPEVGITATSLIIHPSIGYWFGRIGTRFTGMYLNRDHHEFHFNIGYRLHDTKKTQQSINLLTSWIAGSDPGADYKYGATGIAYGFSYRGLFFELGLAIPWRDDIGNLANDPVVPCGYLGYMYRFRPE
jgi:hypothetical protein